MKALHHAQGLGVSSPTSDIGKGPADEYSLSGEEVNWSLLSLTKMMTSHSSYYVELPRFLQSLLHCLDDILSAGSRRTALFPLVYNTASIIFCVWHHAQTTLSGQTEDTSMGTRLRMLSSSWHHSNNCGRSYIQALCLEHSGLLG